MTTTAAIALTACIGVATISGGLMLGLRRPLHTLLWELCVLEHRARFWVRTCIVASFAGVGLATTIGLPMANAAHGVAAIATVVRWQLTGGLMSLLVIATVVMRESRRFARSGPPACAEGDDAWPQRTT